MAVDVNRRSFVAGSAALGAGYALGGPISAYAARTGQDKQRPKAAGYGPLKPGGKKGFRANLPRLPAGFKYRLINRSGAPMRNGLPTAGIFDGMAAYDGPGRTTVLIRNHENRSRPGEITVPVPTGKRYDPDVNVRGHDPELIVSKDRQLDAVASRCSAERTPTAPAGPRRGAPGSPARRSSTTARWSPTSRPAPASPTATPFEVPADANGPVTPQADPRRRPFLPRGRRVAGGRRCLRPRTAVTRAFLPLPSRQASQGSR